MKTFKLVALLCVLAPVGAAVAETLVVNDQVQLRESAMDRPAPGSTMAAGSLVAAGTTLAYGSVVGAGSVVAAGTADFDLKGHDG